MSDSFQQPLISLEPPLRLYHLTGGLSLLVASNRVCTLLSPGGAGLSFFSLLPNAPIPFLLGAEGGIRTLGFTHFGAAQEMQEAVTSNFAIIAPNPNDTCPVHAQSQHWSGVATALHGLGRGTDALLATRIFSQIRHCLTRLERLSSTYRTVLAATRPVKPSTIAYTSDKYAHYLGSEYRSLLNELYSLRDSLLAGVYHLHYARSEPYSIRRIRSLVRNDHSRIGRLIDDSMFSSSGDLLIEHMSLYRSVAQHCTGTTNPIFGDMYCLMVSSSPYGQMPFVVYPLYDNFDRMRGIEHGSSKGLLDPPPRTEAERFLSISSHHDALEFCYDCFVRLLDISGTLASELNIEPKPVVITADEILEMTFTDELGKTTRLKRDKVTGQLVEYRPPGTQDRYYGANATSDPMRSAYRSAGSDRPR